MACHIPLAFTIPEHSKLIVSNCISCDSACLTCVQDKLEMPGSKCPHWEQSSIGNLRELHINTFGASALGKTLSSTLAPRVLQTNWPQLHCGNLLDNIPFIWLFFFPVLFLYSFASSSQAISQINLLIPTSLLQGLFLGRPNKIDMFIYTNLFYNESNTKIHWGKDRLFS